MNDYLTFDALCEIAAKVGKHYPLYKYLVEEKIPNMSPEELQNFKDDLEAAQFPNFTEFALCWEYGEYNF